MSLEAAAVILLGWLGFSASVLFVLVVKYHAERWAIRRRRRRWAGLHIWRLPR